MNEHGTRAEELEQTNFQILQYIKPDIIPQKLYNSRIDFYYE